MTDPLLRADSFFGPTWRAFVTASCELLLQKWREAAPAALTVSVAQPERLEEFSKRMEANLLDMRDKLEVYMTHAAFFVPAGTPCVRVPDPSTLAEVASAHIIPNQDDLTQELDYKTRLLEEIERAIASEEQELAALQSRVQLLNEIVERATDSPITPDLMAHIVREGSGAYNELVALRSVVE